MALTDMLKDGLSLLWRGYEYARDLGAGRGDFSLDTAALGEAGLSAIDLRWLTARGYIAAAPTDASPAFPRLNRPAAGKVTCHVLTDAGVAFACRILSPALEAPHPAPAGAPAPAQAPSWDADRKELRYGTTVVKQFRWAAVNQETILMAFEEDHWPARIDDPLPPKPDVDSKHRLHDTIKCLNRNHKARLIRFSGDGTGEGIVWSARAAADADD